MIGKNNSYSKEAIKARMLQNAARIWGLKSQHSLDPFVVLLIDAFSTEIFKVSNEMHTVNARILDRVAKLLTPSIYTTPRPAHAIAFAMPQEPTELLPHHSEFFIKKQFASTIKAVSDVQLEIPFTPIDNVRLHKLNVSLLVSAHTCYMMDENQNRIPIARMPNYAIPHNKLFIGIDVTQYGEEQLPEALSFYYTNATYDHLDFIYKLLPYVSFSTCGELLAVSKGLSYERELKTEGFDEVFNDFSIREQMVENIKSAYSHKFIELQGFSQEKIVPGGIPEPLSSLAAQREVSTLLQQKKILWIEASFPPQFTSEIIDGSSFTTNAFPVLNRAWKSNECTLDVMGNNIPLFTQLGEHYLYVEEVVDGFGRRYSEIPFTKTDSLKKGYFTVRSGGMERFSDRNAVDMIAYVLELTRDEVAAFGALERDKVVEALKNMTLQMKVLEQKVKNNGRAARENTNYIIIDPIGDMEHVRAAYWVTHTTLANNLRPGTRLVQQKISLANVNKNIVLLTETTGGSDEQKGTDAIQAYKYALTTRDKIVSAEDIKNYCRLVLKGELRSVEVKRGTIISDKPKEGFIRSVEISIVPTTYRQYGKHYWADMAMALKNQIVSRAIDGIEYIVHIMDQDDYK
ncbi:hypothetical protein DBR32_14210 [Taibaiella sp. KBW10]|uniref:type VI secretion system baseplate subunit TssF n=1 Tax=Taibaiella sp. KBW10 TaxID=2153357 RepID=UPI000F5B28B0|nr:type VI secretion system baseplate subunit TssF [Taibaiella sp. KBW10]RQO29736.1 hypothetical protein DBR32_14210 [Taibaiella sp. KBW10]